MERVIILSEYDSLTGRALVQEGSMVYVLTRCCGEKFRFTYGDNVCSGCNQVLEEQGFWSTKFNAASVVGEDNTWSEWVEFWFGLKDAEMTISA